MSRYVSKYHLYLICGGLIIAHNGFAAYTTQTSGLNPTVAAPNTSSTLAPQTKTTPASTTGTAKNSPNTSTDLIQPIDLQLRSLREGNIERAYQDASSEDFKKSTSYPAFQNFVDQNPILKTHKDIQVKPAIMHDEQAEVTVVLDPDKDAIPVVYLLVNENNQWKVWNMAVTPHYTASVTALFKDPTSLEPPIRQQLEALKAGNVLSAYTNYTSQDFKKSTSIEAFRSFLKSYPVLSDFSSIEFKEPVIQKTTGQIEVFLVTPNSKTEIEFTLGIEDDQWKVWGMHVIKQSALNSNSTQGSTGSSQKDTAKSHNAVTVSQEAQPSSQPISGPMTFTRIDIGSRVDLNGSIIDPSTQLKSNSENIYVNLFVSNGVIGTKIDLLMEHIETHSSIPSIATTLQSNGNVQISYVFSAEKSGWPPGHYQLIATTSAGIKQTFSFTMD